MFAVAVSVAVGSEDVRSDCSLCEDSEEDPYVPLEVRFGSQACACKALAGLKQRIVGGARVEAEPVVAAREALCCEPLCDDGRCVVRVVGVCEACELEDEDEAEEICADVRRLAELYGALETVVTLPPSADAPGSCDAVLRYTSHASARAALVTASLRLNSTRGQFLVESTVRAQFQKRDM